jgi:hypothetical protein
VLRVARRDRDLGAGALLAVAHALGDVGGERLGLERLAQDDLVDGLVHDLLEARHVRALLLRTEVDEAFELGVEELLAAVRADADHLLDAGHADAREAHFGLGTAGLDVACEECDALGHGLLSEYRGGHGSNRTNRCTLAPAARHGLLLAHWLSPSRRPRDQQPDSRSSPLQAVAACPLRRSWD